MMKACALTTLGMLALAMYASAQTAPPSAPQMPATAHAFPANSKLAYVDINRIAAESSEGKAARAKLTQAQEAKKAELQKKQDALQAAQQKLSQTGMVLNETARAQLEKDIERLNREFQRAQQDAQDDLNVLNRDMLVEFQRKLMPIVNIVSTEKGLHGVFSLADSGFVWYDPNLDITAEVLKRFEAESSATQPAATKPAPQPTQGATAPPKKP